MTVIRVNHGQFSKDGLRAGDLIALANFLEYIRCELNDDQIQMYIPNESFHSNSHVIEMYGYLKTHTDYFCNKTENMVNVCIKPGTDPTYSDLINLWNIRKDVLYQKQDVIHIHDEVIISADIVKENILIVAPVFDAPYNTNRNWSMQLFRDVLYNASSYGDCTKLVAIKNPIPDMDIRDYGFEYSLSYANTLNLISKCKVFYGGDSGLSHFAGAQSPSIDFLHYYYPIATYGTTLPFHHMKPNAKIHYYPI